MVTSQNTGGERYVPLTSEPEAKGAADAVRGGVRRRRERVHQPPAAIVAGQFEQHPDGQLPEPAALELRQHHPADLRQRLAALIVGPQHHVSSHQVRRGLVRNDHLDPVATGRNRPDVAGHLVLDTLAGQRATQFSHHDRIAPHPHIGIDVAQLNVPQPHPRLERHIYLILPSAGETSPAARRFAGQLLRIHPAGS